MNKFITISIIILAFTAPTFASGSSVKERLQQNIQQPDTEQANECEEKLERYNRKVEEFSKFSHYSIVTPERWKYNHYVKRLKQWKKLCNVSVD